MKCDYRDEKCVRVGHDCAYCNVVDMHLCDTCKKTYPECDGKNVKFGCDIDTYPNTRQNKDNIFYCDGYVKDDTTEEYKGCRNCKYQPEPMQTCDWIKYQKEVYRVCPMWELKEDKGDTE